MPAIRRSQRLRVSDLAALIRLAAEVAELPPDPVVRRKHILGMLCDLCLADKGAYAAFDHLNEIWEVRRGSALFHSTPQHELKRVSFFYVDREPRDPVMDLMSQSPEPIVVCRPRDCFSEADWFNTEHFNEVRQPSQIQEQLYSHYRVNGVSYGIGLHRRGPTPFGKREVALVRLFMENAGRLLVDKPSRSEPLIDELPARLRPVVNTFLAGRSEKEAARELGLTLHTVHTYAKQIYRELNVTSRAEMMALFIKPRA